MSKLICCLAIAGAMWGTAVNAADVGFNVGINIGNQPAVAVPAPPPVYAPPPARVYATPVVIEEPPEFIEPPELGFYAAVGVPYDLFFISNRYYLFNGNAWYAGPGYNGPWASVAYRALPSPLRRFPVERVRYYRDAGFRDYRHARNPYWEKHRFHPEKEWKEHRKAEKEAWKEHKKWEHEREKHEQEAWKHGRDNYHGEHDRR